MTFTKDIFSPKSVQISTIFMDYIAFKKFLNLFQYGIDNCKKKESISYIIETMQKSENTNKVLTFDKLADIEYSPNPCLDRKGELYFNTKRMKEMFDAYLQSIKYVNTEIAQLEREKFLTMHDIASQPFLSVTVPGEDETEAK